MDLRWGFYQCRLAPESQLLTTFLLPEGKFCYTRLPMGLSISGDEFCQMTDAIIEGLPGVQKLIDDLLLEAETEKELMQRIRLVLDRARKHNMIISRKKLQAGREVRFAGYIISEKGVKPDPSALDGLRKFPLPKDASALRSFLGLATQFSSYIPDLAHMVEPMRGLTKTKVNWKWLPDHTKAFQQTIKALTWDVMVKP